MNFVDFKKEISISIFEDLGKIDLDKYITQEMWEGYHLRFTEYEKLYYRQNAIDAIVRQAVKLIKKEIEKENNNVAYGEASSKSKETKEELEKSLNSIKKYYYDAIIEQPPIIKDIETLISSYTNGNIFDILSAKEVEINILKQQLKSKMGKEISINKNLIFFMFLFLVALIIIF